MVWVYAQLPPGLAERQAYRAAFPMRSEIGVFQDGVGGSIRLPGLGTGLSPNEPYEDGGPMAFQGFPASAYGSMRFSSKSSRSVIFQAPSTGSTVMFAWYWFLRV